MKRTSIALVLGGIAALLASGAGSAIAATPTIYSVKFVCGQQHPVAGITAPAEPPVKPGNYATVINVEGLSESDATNFTLISVAGGTTAAGPNLVLGTLITKDITCADIATALKSSASFITGFVNIKAVVPVTVTAVYTSQGCAFSPFAIAVLPPVCSGATSIEVVPQTPSVLVLPEG